MTDQRRTLFVGGPRHGKTVPGQPTKEGELYRVPGRGPKDEPVVYRAADVSLTFPHPLTGEPGDTYSCFVYVIPELYPDNPGAANQLQAALAEATMRLYIMGNGINVTGGPEAVAAARIPVFVAWCEAPECAAYGGEYETRKARADWMTNHKTSTGHTARWEDKER